MLSRREVQQSVQSTYGMKRTPDSVQAEVMRLQTMRRSVAPRDWPFVQRRIDVLKGSKEYGRWWYDNAVYHILMREVPPDLVHRLEADDPDWEALDAARVHIGWEPLSPEWRRKWDADYRRKWGFW